MTQIEITSLLFYSNKFVNTSLFHFLMLQLQYPTDILF
jgi:hypothetical protein